MAKSKKTTRAKCEVTIDRRSGKQRRGTDNRRNADGGEGKKEVPERRTSQRRTVTRRRQIDPTTCERDYTADEIEFMQAMDAYKRSSGRMFPTCSEVLEVIRGLGYQRPSDRTTPTPPGEMGEQAAKVAAEDSREDEQTESNEPEQGLPTLV